MLFATKRISRTGLFAGLSLILSSMVGVAFAQDDTTIKQINAPPAAPKGPVLSTINAPGFIPPKITAGNVGTWGSAVGFLSLPTGSGTVHNGHEFLTSNKQPTQSTTDHSSGAGSRSSTFRSLGVLFRREILGALIVREQD